MRRKLFDQFDLAVVLLDTGARYSEAATLTWAAVDTTTWQRLILFRSKVGKEGQIALTERLCTVLRDRWNRRPNSAYVFAGYGEGDGPRGHATAGIQKAIDRAGCNAPDKVKRFGRATPHTFRDTFASRLVQAGVSLYKVQELLGHSSPKMTQKCAHLAPGSAADEAALVLDAIRAQIRAA